MQFDARKAKLLAPGAHLIIDDCPGLRFAVTSTGRAWIYRFKSPVDGKMRQVKIGQWPALSYSAAVEAWEQLRDARSAGRDPAIEKKAVRAAEKQSAVQAKIDKQLEAYTVRKLCEDYYQGHIVRNRKEKGATEIKRMFVKMLDDIADLPATAVTRSIAFSFLENYLDIPVQCAKIKSELGAAWDYALDAGRLPPETPNWWRLVMTRRLKSKGKVIAGKNIGTAKRSLSEPELAMLIKWLPNFPRAIADALTLYLWTGTRGAEIVQIEAHEITTEPDGLWWTIPKSKTKNARHENATDHRVPLVGRAAVIIERRKLAVGTGYLFPSRGKVPYLEQKAIQTAVWNCQPGCTSRPEVVRARLPVTNWAPHDLRRSTRTLLAKMGCPDPVGEAIIGHMAEGVKGIYNLHTYDKERREWLTLLDSRLESLVK